MPLSRSFVLLLALIAGCTGKDVPLAPAAGEPVALGGIVASTEARAGSPDVPGADLTAAVAGNTAFALDLYREIRSPGDNLFFAPFSISEALAMTWAGARGGTAAQMAAALRFTLPQERLHPAFDAIALALESRGQGGGSLQLDIANALWAQKGLGFAAPFLDTLARSYGTGVHVVDFAAAPDPSRRIINDWVAAQTHGHIGELFAPGTVTPDTRLVLADAVYFNAAWTYPFDRAATAPADFTRSDGARIQVPTMRQQRELRYASSGDTTAVELPYGTGQLAMVIVLTNQGPVSVPGAGLVVPAREGGLEAFEASLTADKLASILGALSPREVALTLPRFSIASSFDLVDPLGALGMTDAFSDRADFSGIDGRTDLSIGAVVHQARVDVDEGGTVAAAATGVGIVASAVELPAIVHVDHPFLFFIRDVGTGTLVFVGRVDDPSR